MKRIHCSTQTACIVGKKLQNACAIRQEPLWELPRESICMTPLHGEHDDTEATGIGIWLGSIMMTCKGPSHFTHNCPEPCATCRRVIFRIVDDQGFVFFMEMFVTNT